ncbi:unnamed protein product [Spirodela intermedia]|uniref:Uncharacterized protein n=1 Tax=Spirodela intermedia TaxID=51605 RepID=A0A7I8J747_SPIIN|nr:unnamed protein product [Spirodela intermedia]CAA6665889.1 unnamed protein product [Spirodela intermedia]
MSQGKSPHIGDDDSLEVFSISKSNFITFQDRIEKIFNDISDTLKQLFCKNVCIRESFMPSYRDHEIRCLQKVTHVESSSYTYWSFGSTSSMSRFEEDNFQDFNEDWLTISVSDYVEKIYHLSSQIDLIKSESYMISRFKGGLR